MLKSLSYGGIHFTECPPEFLAANGVPAEVIAAALAAQKLAEAQDARRAAYVVESDPLFLEWQYDQTPESEQAWRDKVAEIKARYPLPAE
ncbi:TPA: hypothetical protein SL768_006069 [Pseudomonas aeruginosa]|uniref:hypothetical protein n=1 Tax=Pseudomonas aeruginosa TaxID=287 RepID=UPI001049B094|nr:hypothetical protein [Pseudomonas aeruginosa]HDQ4100720.1 hypothetical protein [Pseudomonas aeruginosa]HEJ5739517.1 hypothetical protein [Pseudomonas aeruginosa]HEJ6168221.1 hypothetical protein [Pseudomonas aeruginosa]